MEHINWKGVISVGFVFSWSMVMFLMLLNACQGRNDLQKEIVSAGVWALVLIVSVVIKVSLMSFGIHD